MKVVHEKHCQCGDCKHQRRIDRRNREATFPKCFCGATLGLERSAAGITRCRRCLPDSQLTEQDELAKLEILAIRAESFKDLRIVVLDIVRRMRNAQQRESDQS